MAARKLSPKHDAHTRQKIQTSQLINRLQSFVLGGKDPKTKETIEISAVQATVALGLLRKVLPDLTTTELKGGVEHSYVARMPDMPKTADEWQEQHSPTIQ